MVRIPAGEFLYGDEKEKVTPPVVYTACVRILSYYTYGLDNFDLSYSIENTNGGFLGECGVGIAESISTDSPKNKTALKVWLFGKTDSPKNVTAFDVWLFDKNDIRTVTKVIMSDYAFFDDAIKAKLASTGEPLLARENEVIVLETTTLIINAEIKEMKYGEGGNLPLQSYFETFALEVSVWAKGGDAPPVPDTQVEFGEFLYSEKKGKVILPEYWIDKTPVTNAEYGRFVAATGHEPPNHWKGQTPPKELANHPVTYVSWHDAVDYADWAGCRLPTEQEWEKAARGTDGREYPWGSKWRENHCNTRESGIKGTTAVGQFSPQGDSPYGCVDMSGNVWEWTEGRAVRGGSWDDFQDDARVSFRYDDLPHLRYFDGGFRVVAAVLSGS